METETQTSQSALPFAPLTLAELNARSAAARDLCGHRCINIVRDDGRFLDLDLTYLAETAAAAWDYHAAAMVRVEAQVA